MDSNALIAANAAVASVVGIIKFSKAVRKKHVPWVIVSVPILFILAYMISKEDPGLYVSKMFDYLLAMVNLMVVGAMVYGYVPEKPPTPPVFGNERVAWREFPVPTRDVYTDPEPRPRSEPEPEPQDADVVVHLDAQRIAEANLPVERNARRQSPDVVR
jgi:hypothetical protein